MKLENYFDDFSNANLDYLNLLSERINFQTWNEFISFLGLINLDRFLNIF